MENFKFLNILAGSVLLVVLGYFALTRLGKPDGPEIDGLANSSFKQTVMTSDSPVLVDFYADWCGPCRAMSPVVDEFAGKHPNVVVVRVNVDNHQDIARYFGVRSIPTFMVFKNGKLTARRSGSMDGKALRQMVGK